MESEAVYNVKRHLRTWNYSLKGTAGVPFQILAEGKVRIKVIVLKNRDQADQVRRAKDCDVLAVCGTGKTARPVYALGSEPDAEGYRRFVVWSKSPMAIIVKTRR